MKRIDKILFCVLLLQVSCNSVDENLYGKWGIHSVIYKNEDISGIDFSQEFFAGNFMIIDETQDCVTLPVKSERVEFADFKVFNRGSKQFITLFNATDSRFNDTFLIKITEKNEGMSGMSMTYEIELRSQNMLII